LHGEEKLIFIIVSLFLPHPGVYYIIIYYNPCSAPLSTKWRGVGGEVRRARDEVIIPFLRLF